MSTDLVVRHASLADKMNYAEKLQHSGMLPVQYRKQPSNILWAIEYGETIGISTMAAITGVHVIEGKPSASAALITGLVRRAGHKLRVRGNNACATVQIIRTDDPDFVYEVTWELMRNERGNPNAEEAGLLKKAIWQNYPASMLKSRAITQCARDACEEVLFGLHFTPEELGAAVEGEEGDLIVDAGSTPAVFMASTDQLNAINGAMIAKNITERYEKINYLNGLWGRSFKNSAELTAAEAIETLATLLKIDVSIPFVYPEAGDDIEDAEIVEESSAGAEPSTEQPRVDPWATPAAAPTAESNPAPAAEHKPGPDPAIPLETDAQLKTMHTALTNAGLTKPADRLAYCSKAVGRQLGSTHELTWTEARGIAKKISQEPKPDPIPDATAVDQADTLFADLQAGMEGAANEAILDEVYGQAQRAVAAGTLSQGALEHLKTIGMQVAARLRQLEPAAA